MNFAKSPIKGRRARRRSVLARAAGPIAVWAVASLANRVQATTYTWVGVAPITFEEPYWDEPDNWSPDTGYPTNGDTAVVSYNPDNYPLPVLQAGDNPTVGELDYDGTTGNSISGDTNYPTAVETLSVTGAFNWTGSGSSINGGGTSASSFVVAVSNGFNLLLPGSAISQPNVTVDNATINNSSYGTGTWNCVEVVTGNTGSPTTDFAVINNAANATLDLLSSSATDFESGMLLKPTTGFGDPYEYAPNSTFNNAGTLNSSGGFTNTFGAYFNNSGSVVVQNGVLALVAGETNPQTGSISVTNGATLQIGNINYTPGYSILGDPSSYDFQFTSLSSVSGGGSVTFGADFGNTTFEAGSAYNITGNTTNSYKGALTFESTNVYFTSLDNQAGTNTFSLPYTPGLFISDYAYIEGSNVYDSTNGMYNATTTIDSTSILKVSNFYQTALVDNGGFTLHVNGTGTVGPISGMGTVGPITGTGGIILQQGSRLTIAPSTTYGTNFVSTVGSLTLYGTGSSMGTLDITNNALVIQYAPNGGSFNPAIEATVRAEIINGFNDFNWNGNGITSSIAAADAATGEPYGGLSAVGYADNNDLGRSDLPNNSVLVRFTLYGDADLNGVVDLNDYDDWLYGYQGGTDAAGGVSWSIGDFAYTGHVTLEDFDLWLASYTSDDGALGTLDHAIKVSTLSSSEKTDLLDVVASVPEPASFSLLALAAMGLPCRRRKRSTKP